MKYIKKNCGKLLLCIGIMIAYNAYFLYLLDEIKYPMLGYLDFLLIVILLGIMIIDMNKFYREDKRINELLEEDTLICDEIKDNEVIKHDVEILENMYQEQCNINDDLQDYIAKWIHEIKLPLTAATLINESNTSNKEAMQEQLERINNQLSRALVGCRVQSNILDLQIKRVDLRSIVNDCIRNNRYFLIKKQFEINIDIQDIEVFSDYQWLVYCIDQIISNAIKYASDKPKLDIYVENKNNITILCIKDNGEGIKDSDISRIFDKGYTGENHHNGLYKSTGMGLYFVSKMLKKLQHNIEVESKYHEYTVFKIYFDDLREYMYR